MKNLLSRFLRNLRQGACAAAWLAASAAGVAPQLAHAMSLAPKEPATAMGTLVVVLPARDGQVAAAKAASGIPDAKVWLLDSRQNEVGSAVTGLDGKFRLKTKAAGGYRFCWEIQGRTACDHKFDLKPHDNYIGLIEARLKQPYVFGTVLNRDKRVCWERDPFFKIDVSTKLSALDAGGQTVATTRANTSGRYVLALKSAGVHKIQAACEKAEVTAATPSSIGASGVQQLDLVLPNSSPRLDEFAVRAGGKGILRADPGQPIEFGARAFDADNDPVEYLIRANDGSPVATGPTGFFTTTAPAHPGRYSNYLIARDGRGGYAWKRLDLEVGPPVVRVSGNVVDETTRQPVAGATVEIAGTTATTGAGGGFSVETAETADRRYVLNIRHPDYALLSHVFDRSTTGNTFGLMRAHVQTFKPNALLRISDKLIARRCDDKTGADGKHVVRRIQTRENFGQSANNKKQTKPLSDDLIKRRTAPLPCLRAGAEIVVPAGALVNAKTGAAAAPGLARAAIATIDPTQRPIPGDYQAIDRGGQRIELLSYGAVHAEFRDAAGNLLNLKPGTKAEVWVPIPAAQQASAKPSIDFWSYDEASGRWKIEGKATLQMTAAGPMYMGHTTHFSTLNMDIADDVADATCVRFELGTSLASWSDLKLRSTVSYNGDQVKTKIKVLDRADQYHAVLRIPFGSTLPPNTLRVELIGTADMVSVVLADDIINTDQQPQMLPGAGLWPSDPFNECLARVTLEADEVNLPEYKTNSATGRPYFLTGPGGGFLPPDGETIATNYYAVIGATALKPTLGSWWFANGFDETTGDGGTNVAYLNHNDLGFGRDMHCLKDTATGKLACYVTNYGLPNNNASNADDAKAKNLAAQGATVAMEFNPTPEIPDDERVQFYVYGKGAASGLLKFADLDGFGPKPIPQLCQVCHGGGPELAASGRAKFARFREFDLPSLRYPAATPGNPNVQFDFAPAPQGISDTDAGFLRTLNLHVRDAHPTTPIGELITEWYAPNPTVPLAPQQPTPRTSPPSASEWLPGWSTEVNAYHKVYGTSCRTCHIARDEGGGTAFATAVAFSGTDYVVCGSGKVMPNAIITYKNFWQDLIRVALYEGLTGATDCRDTLPTP